MEAEWCILAMVICAIIGTDNGLVRVQCQAIIWTNAGLLLTEPSGIKFNEIRIKMQKSFIQGNPFENVICKMTAILSQPQRVN